MFKNEQNNRSANLGILVLSLLLVFGCSASHQVAVVSHSEEVTAMKDPVSDNTSETTIPPLIQEKQTLPSPDTPKPLPSMSPVEPPADKSSIAQEIFAESAEDTTLPWTLQDVFFDYDQMVIRRDAIPILEQNAEVLLRRLPNREVLIQGHCDERGTEAYNLILGERRANAVKNYLINLGVAASRLRVLSLGKSQPFCLQRTHPCFQQNRRAHFVLK